MRKVGGLMLAMLVACAALVGAASAGAAELPTYDGSPTFPEIHGQEDPEEYSWRVRLDPKQELRQIDAAHAEVVWAEDGIRAYLITAEEAHAADGVNVPTTMAVTAPDVLTLTVHHQEGNPAAGGAPFDYPILAGQGWESRSQTTVVPVGPLENPVSSAAAAEPATSQQVRVTRALGEDHLYYRPHFFLLSGDGTFGMNRVRWLSYGGATAKATARAFVNDCVPYCAAGHVTHPRATLRLSKLIDCNGTPIYAHLDYALTGPLPKGFPRRGGYSMRPLGEDGKPEC